ncbi:MAG TPA: ABC-2 family transporter protein [Propionibacteriaceae bacterium]
MRTYVELAKAEFARYSTYRLAILAGVFTNSVFGFIRVSVLIAAITTAGGVMAGYTIQEASTYVWLGQAFLSPIVMYGWTEIADRVKSGEIAVDLARPVDLQLSWWARDLGRAAFALPTRGIPPFLIGALVVGVALPASWTAYPLGLFSLVVGVSISFTLRFLVNLIAFWTLDIQGYVNLYVVLLGLLSGFYVPVHIFPGWLQTIAFASPFPAMFQSPIDVMSGRVLGVEALGVIGVQLGWLAGLVALARVVLGRATRRLVVQGG